MTTAKENLQEIITRMKGNTKVEDMFTTNVGGKDISWDMKFQFNLENADPFYLEIKNKEVKIAEGTVLGAEVLLTGDPNSVVNICNGKGDFTHAISREEITVVEGKVMDVIRLTKAITIVLKTK
jgi:hypothetical protein